MATKGTKQTPEHIAKRIESVRLARSLWDEEKIAHFKKAISASAKGRPAWNKGKPFSEESRRKMSEVHKGIQAGEKHPMYGKKMPSELKEKLRLINTGKKQSPELVKKRFDARAGYKHAPETKAKIGKSNSGKGNGNWLGGASREPYALIWGSRLFKNGIRERDKYICQNPDCRGNCNVLSIHHIDYNKKNCNPENLITLCRSCNGRANFNRDFWEAGYQEIIRAKYSVEKQEIAI